MDTDGLRQLIVQKRELLARETFSRRAFNRCENMSDEMKNRYVEYLIERLENTELDNCAMKLVLEDLTKELSRSNQMLEKLNDLQSLLEEERESRKSLERENIKLKEQLKSARKNRFGSKKQSVKKDASGSDDDPVDREKEKDGFDGTDESVGYPFRCGFGNTGIPPLLSESGGSLQPFGNLSYHGRERNSCQALVGSLQGSRAYP